MKKLLSLILALFLASSVTFAFSSLQALPSHNALQFSKWQKPEPIFITFNYMDGTFTCSGAVNTSGTWTMDVRFAGMTFHCINTLYAEDGSILVAISHCNARTMGGQWNITEGSGIFSGMKGNGSLMMTEVAEEWQGTVR